MLLGMYWENTLEMSSGRSSALASLASRLGMLLGMYWENMWETWLG